MDNTTDNRQDPSNKNENPIFNWTDELVNEYHSNAGKYYQQGHSFESAIKLFKQSKQQPVESRIEVMDFMPDESMTPHNWYSLYVTKKIPEDKYEGVKKAISDYLNGNIIYSDWYVKQLLSEIETLKKNSFSEKECIPTLERQDKRWYIMDYDKIKYPETKPVDQRDIMIPYTVVRKKDKVHFIKGMLNNGKIIDKFFEGWNGMEIHYTDGSGSLLLEEPYLPKQPKSIPENKPQGTIQNKETEVKHLEDIPCLSLKDILEVLGSTGLRYGYAVYEKLHQLVKNKKTND